MEVLNSDNISIIALIKEIKHKDFYWYIGLYALIYAIIGHMSYILVFAYLDIPILVVLNIFGVAIYVYILLFLAKKAVRNHDDSMIGWFVFADVYIDSVLGSIYLGLDSGFQYYMYILILIPFFTMHYSKPIRFLRIFTIIITAIVLNLYLQDRPAMYVIDSYHFDIISSINLILFLAITSAISYNHTANAHTYQEVLLHSATIDPLTELYNRRYLIEHAERNMKDARRTKYPISLLIIDIDNFKSVNDTYGHNAGDVVIVEISKVLKRVSRPNTIVARWGGEEFVVFVPNCTDSELQVIAERILVNIAQEKIEYEGITHNVTVTIGGATLEEDESFKHFTARADSALYKGKHAGKNCYIKDN